MFRFDNAEFEYRILAVDRQREGGDNLVVLVLLEP
jgi:hypothetical protein